MLTVDLTSSCLRTKDELTHLTRTYRLLIHNHSATIPVILDQKKTPTNCFLDLDLLGRSKSWFFFLYLYFFYKIHPMWITLGKFYFYLWSLLAGSSPPRYCYLPHNSGNLTNSSTQHSPQLEENYSAGNYKLQLFQGDSGKAGFLRNNHVQLL